jgi:RNA polymerase sigma-70 factor (ECF subfamily)
LELTDQHLVLRMQAGDLEALGGIYDRHQLLVYRSALAISGDPEAAADITQDVFLRLFRFAHRIDPQRPLEPWLYRMTANMSYTWVKRQSRWMNVLREMAVRLSRERRITPLQRIELDEEWQLVQNALQTLPPEKRVVVVLYYINELSLQEIADTLQIPIGTVKSRLHYGRQSLKRQLGIQQDRLPEVGYEAL